VTLETEPACETMCFSHTFQPVPLRRGMGLRAATDAVSGLPFGGTDCSLPMQWALQQGRVFDVFVVYTDSET
jgi:60 kDa SS-A/Ro ribonucleoprotein